VKKKKEQEEMEISTRELTFDEEEEPALQEQEKVSVQPQLETINESYKNIHYYLSFLQQRTKKISTETVLVERSIDYLLKPEKKSKRKIKKENSTK